MRKRIINICIVVILVFGLFGCTQTAEDVSSAEAETDSEEKSAVEDKDTAMVEEEVVPPESVDDQGETDTESLDILREIEEYRSHFIGLYTSNALSDEFPDVEPAMLIEGQPFPNDNGEGASLTVYSDLSGKRLRYEVQYFGETGNIVINYYLCDDFVWISRQYNCYSSSVLRAGYSDVLYSTIENWIVTDEAVYIMHENGKLEKIDKTQLEIDIPMPEEIENVEREYSQSKKEEESDKDFTITWDVVDYNVVDLHFNFEDGTVIDREIVAYDVRDIVYKDITGDDIDEALIYCDFANNTCDWQLIYFYQVDQENVMDISPSSKDIPELNNADWGIWNMWWIAAETMEGYSSPIYKLEDYYKEQGVVYVDETLYIGYRDGKWELVQDYSNNV